MQKIGSRLLFILIVFMGSNLLAQEANIISGIVVDEQQDPIKGATVFISGSKKITATDIDGRFAFKGVAAGNYTVSTNMLGYSTPSQPITVHDKSLDITITMNVKPTLLKEVQIGARDNWDKHYALFKEHFLGSSGNAKHAVILNPEVLSFSSQKFSEYHMSLEADADDLLIIENKRLGYRVKYLLRTFSYNPKTRVTFYDGDSYFEELDGTEKQKEAWARNRLKAYRGSLMHFSRSVFARTVLNEGFIAKQMVKSSNVLDTKNYMMPDPVNFDALVSILDSSFVSFKFTALNIDYDPKKATRLKNQETEKEEEKNQDDLSLVDQSGKSSQLLLHLEEAVIDAKGSILTGYRTFLIRGNWADKRIGDQLPFEYQPQKTTDEN